MVSSLFNISAIVGSPQEIDTHTPIFYFLKNIFLSHLVNQHWSFTYSFPSSHPAASTTIVVHSLFHFFFFLFSCFPSE